MEALELYLVLLCVCNCFNTTIISECTVQSHGYTAISTVLTLGICSRVQAVALEEHLDLGAWLDPMVRWGSFHVGHSRESIRYLCVLCGRCTAIG